jgi:serine/threonine protein phosphatase PrpC
LKSNFKIISISTPKVVVETLFKGSENQPQRIWTSMPDSLLVQTSIGIEKVVNEDRILIQENQVTVIDGLGGHGDGDKAADLLAKHVINQPDDIDEAVYSASEAMHESNLKPKSGAAFLTYSINKNEESKLLNIKQAGDVKLVVYRKDGIIKFQTDDETDGELRILMKDLQPSRAITEDQLLYHPSRHHIINYVTYRSSTSTAVRVVITATDGIFDNLTPEDVGTLVAVDSDDDDLFMSISSQSEERMRQSLTKEFKDFDRSQHEFYPDGFKSQPKSDNWSLVIHRIS